MKKNLFGWLAMATMLVGTGCSSDDVVNDYSPENAIEFGTYLGRDAQGRAAELTTEGLRTSGFGVFASYTNEGDWANNKTNFMYNQSVTYSSGWTYNPKKYWPTNRNDKISFWAYGPYANDDNGITIKSLAGAETTPILTYKLETAKLATQADLTTDVAMNVTNGATTDPDGTHRTVDFALRHELTRVAISAKLDKDIDVTTKVNIKSVTFGGANFATKADYTFAATTDARGSWSNGTMGTLSLENILNKQDASNLGDYDVDGVFLTSETAVKLFGENKYLFLIPFAEGLDAGVVTMTVEYDIVTYDDALSGDHSVTSATKIITFPTNMDLFKQGFAYNLNLTFYMNEIVLSATVDGSWGSGADYNTDVDWNDVDPA